jgi:hypothetical protein
VSLILFFAFEMHTAVQKFGMQKSIAIILVNNQFRVNRVGLNMNNHHPLSFWLVPHKPTNFAALRNFFEAKQLLLKTVINQSRYFRKTSQVIDIVSITKLFIQKRLGRHSIVYGLISGLFNKHYIEVQILTILF